MSAASGLGAEHVVATLILFNGLVALRAFLGVRPDPADVLRLRAVLDVPLVHHLAVGRPMRLLAARPAPMETT